MTRKKKNAGFTLVEMVVTITIIAIIASLTVYGIFTWQDWARFNRQNEYAQTLFVAAQNQLSEYSANGKLKEMQDSLAGGSYESAKEGASEDELVFTSNGLNLTDQMGKIVSEEGNYDLKKLFPESDGKKDADGKDVSYLYRDEIVSLRAQAGDYASYLADPDAMKASNPEAYWLFELLGAYVYDSSILNGDENQTTAICLEITPEDGQVFSVLYSDRNRQFIYEGIQDGVAESEHVSSIANRTEEYRRERMIGYYGVDTLYVATKNKMSAPDIHRVMLVNKDSFYMEMLVPSAFAGLFQYEVDLDASKSITDKKLTLIVEGTKLKSKEKTTEPIKCQAYRYDSSKGKIDLGEFLVYAWLEKDASPAYTKVHIEYDAADIQATTYKYESDLDDIRSDIPQKSASTSFAQTRSFFRFGLDTSDVYATVVGKAAGYLDTKPASNFGNLNPLKNQNGKNPVFASIKITKTGDDADFKYTIINPRHLYNIRYIEDLPYEKEADGYKEIAKVNKVEFELKNDIDFGQFQAKGNLYYTDVKTDKINLSNLDGKIYALNDDAITEVTNTNCDFPSFKQLRVNDKFGGADGKNWIIKGIQTSEISNILYMVYNPVAPGNTKSADDLKEVLKPTGLFNVNYGEIKNLTMDDFSVRGSDMVGAFCGINAGVVTNLTSENTNKVSKVLGVKHVGGIMGIQLMTKQTNVIEKLNNKAGVYGTESVGGIVGMVRNDSSTKIFDYTKLSLSVDALNALNKDDNKTVLVRECKNNGPVLGTKKTDLKGVYNMSATGDSMGMPEDDPEKVRYIGGIVGYCYNKDTTKEKLSNITIDKCVSAPQYKADTLNEILGSKESLTEKLVGDYVGGIVGYNRYGTISNCEAKVEKDCPGYIFGYRYVGGIVGLNVGPLDGAKDSTTNGVNENNVIGCHYVGGIAGTNATLKEKAKKYNSDMTVETADPEVLSSDDAILEVATSKNLNLELSNWTNKGVVIATEEYAGGIAGYNTGWILGCTSEIIKSNVDSFYESLAKIIDLGNYCGGIAGYNNGIVGNTERNKTTGNKTGAAGEKLDSAVYVKGHNYVGGVVGYNDENAIVEDYAVIDGYVEGCENHFSDNAKSCFAGGYVGFNASPNLFMDLDEDTNTARRINASPETVHGDYFVGGAIGGNVINTMVYNEDAGDTPDPGTYDNAYDASKKDTEHVYAQIEKTNQYGTNPNVTLQMSLSIINNSDDTISGWRVPVEKAPFEKWPNYGIGYEDTRKEFYALSADKSTVAPHSNSAKMNFSIGGTEAQIEKFLSEYVGKNIPIMYYVPEDNKKNTYYGEATNKDQVTVKFEGGSKSNDYYRQYKVILVNNTKGTMPNWRIEIDLPKGAEYSAISAQHNNGACKLERSGDSLIIKSLSDKYSSVDLYNNPQVIQIDVSFSGEAQAKTFEIEEDKIRVSFNNVLYSGTMPKGSGNGNLPGGQGGSNPTPTPIGHDLLAEYKTDGFLGLLEGEEFVGGFIGYNLCFENDNTDGWVIADNDDADRGAVFALQTKLVEAFKTSDAANLYSEVASYQDKKAILDHLNEALSINTTTSGSKFVVSGAAKDEEQTQNGTVSGQVYVGGVLGYCDAKTKLLLHNIENTNSIDAKQAIPYDREQLVLASNGLEERNTDYRGKSCAYTYSYAGGLIGKTWENAVVDGCKNNGMIRAKGTYTGALTEINEGTIQNCSVENFSPDKDSCIYYGGLCGLNKGLVTECEMNDKTITNDNVTVIGAIAAENFGIIKKITMKKPVIAPVDEAYEDVDGVTGLFAGYNGRSGQIEFADVAGALDLKNVKVQSNGRYVGALAGINDGILTNNKNTVVESDKSKNFILTGTVAGYGEVGGLVGYNRSQVTSSTIHNITVKPVTSESVDDVIFAKSGNVGSVFGKNDEKCKFLYCVNALTVKTTDGTAGGLIGENNNVINIENCKNEGKVETESGIAAGFVGEQKNSIFTVTGCENYGEIASTAKNGEDNAIAGFIGVISGIKGTGDSNTLIFITDSNNHGSVHMDRNNSTDYAGGFIGKAYRCSSIDISLYNCDETGIVSKLGSTTRDTKIGSFVGLGTGINLNFEMCQNYNVSKSANGYVGSGGTVSLLDCFDNSNVSYQSFKVTTNYPGNIPYGTNSVSYGKVSNNYVLNQNSNPSGDFIDFINKFGIVKNDRYTYLYERYNQKAFYYRKNAWDLIPANAFETRTNNPVSPTYYADISDYFESEKAGVDSRISVYKELHNIIEELIKGDYAVSGKLGETDNITLKEDEILDRIDVEWEAVKGAYKYELKYRYKNSENKDVESEVFTLGAGVTRYSIPISQEIRDKEIIFLVRAISVDGKHDGNWKESEPFFTKMPFSPLALHPEIVLHDDGDIALDSIKYDFTFDTLVDDEERADLGGYLITAKSLDNEAAGNKYLYVKEFNTKIKGNDIDLDIETLEESGTVEEIASENFAISGQERTVTIDCSEFKQGEKIEISVKAIPSTAAEKYRSGEEENAPFEMFNKLATPNIQMITVDDEASIAGIKSEEETWIEKQEYSKEIAIGITDAEQYADCPDVTAELAIAVYANREEVNSTNQMEEGSALWYSGAESVMYDKANPLSIGLLNDLVSGQTYQLNISQLENYTGQYAGKWLKIAYRVYSDKMIPSLYTDEDEEGVSVNYMWLHIPSIELADIDVTCSEAQNADIFAKEDITAMTKTIEFKENSDVDGYKIDIVSQEISVSENGIEARWPIAELRVEKHLANPADVQSADGTVDIYLTDETLYRGEEAGDIYKEDSEETYLGNMPLIDEQTMDIPELFAIYEEVFEDICDEPVMATAKLKYNRGPEDDCGVFTLQLPDIVGVNDISYEEREELFNTAKVMIEPYLYGRESAHCKLGKSVLWQRTKETEITDGEEETIYGSELIQLSNEADAVGKTEVTYWLESLVEFLKKF